MSHYLGPRIVTTLRMPRVLFLRLQSAAVLAGMKINEYICQELEK